MIPASPSPVETVIVRRRAHNLTPDLRERGKLTRVLRAVKTLHQEVMSRTRNIFILAHEFDELHNEKETIICPGVRQTLFEDDDQLNRSRLNE